MKTSIGNDSVEDVVSDDWSLTPVQMLYMMQHNNTFEAASKSGDAADVLDLANSEAFKTLFGEMGIDEAYDRYLTVLN